MERKKCPYCGEEIAAAAKKCRFCGEWLESSGCPASGSPSTSRTPSLETTAAPRVENPVVANPQPAAPTKPYSQPADKTPVSTSQENEEGVYDSTSTSFFNAYFVNPYLRRYADFKGCTTRKSFWLSYVATTILSIGLCGLALLLSSFGIGGIIVGYIICGLIGLALVLPGLALCVRRLRDVNKNPLMILLVLIPVVGSIFLLIIFCQKSKCQETREKAYWLVTDWIVTCSCAVLLTLGIIFSVKSLSGNSSYELETYEDGAPVEEVIAFDYNEDTNTVEIQMYEDNRHGSSNNVPSLIDIADVIDPAYFTYELETYRIGSDRRLVQLLEETGSTNVHIQANGMISNYIISMQGWITENGTIHGRYHNENGTNLDFNGYIRRDNSLYIQLGHDGEKSDWLLQPVESEFPSGYYRYEGKWGKSKKDSFVTFSEM